MISCISETVSICSDPFLPIESATPSDEFSSGKTMDADRITPNGGTVEWAF